MKKWNTKGKVWSGIKTFWTIQNSYPVISSVNKLKKREAEKSMSTFDFSKLYTKIPHCNLLYILYEITDFAFNVKQKIILLFIIQEHFGHIPKVKLEDLTLSSR